jgi:hypothetical protein
MNYHYKIPNKSIDLVIFIIFGLTQPGLEPTNYYTKGEHANHYTTDAVC